MYKVGKVIQAVDPQIGVWLTCSVKKHKGTKVFVRWTGYLPEDDCWVDAELTREPIVKRSLSQKVDPNEWPDPNHPGKLVQGDKATLNLPDGRVGEVMRVKQNDPFMGMVTFDNGQIRPYEDLKGLPTSDDDDASSSEEESDGDEVESQTEGCDLDDAADDGLVNSQTGKEVTLPGDCETEGTSDEIDTDIQEMCDLNESEIYEEAIRQHVGEVVQGLDRLVDDALERKSEGLQTTLRPRRARSHYQASYKSPSQSKMQYKRSESPLFVENSNEYCTLHEELNATTPTLRPRHGQHSHSTPVLQYQRPVTRTSSSRYHFRNEPLTSPNLPFDNNASLPLQSQASLVTNQQIQRSCPESGRTRRSRFQPYPPPGEILNNLAARLDAATSPDRDGRMEVLERRVASLECQVKTLKEVLAITLTLFHTVSETNMEAI